MSNLLIGKKITDVKIATDKQALLFVSDSGEELIARTDGDCCSYSWIETVEMPALGLPFTVIAIDDLDLPGSDDNHPEHECLTVYGAKIATDKGEMIIDYRNESNGYYGGSIEWPNDDEYSYFYGGVHGQNASSLEWTEIEEQQ